MREEPVEPTPALRECIPARKVLKPSVWTRLGSRMEQTTLKKRTSRCPLMGCTSESRHLSRHVYQRHLPGRVQLGNLADPAWQVARLLGLRWLALQIVGDDRLGTLLDFAHKHDLGINAEVSLSEVDRQWLSEFARQSGWPEVDFDIQRLNSQALLAHWRVLVGLLKHIPRDRQVFFFNLDNQGTSSTVPAVAGLHVQSPDVEHPSTPTPPVVAVTEPAGSGTAHAVSNVRNMSVREYLAVSGQANLSLAWGNTSQASGRPVTTRISAFDSHFHLDRSLVKLGMPYYSDIRTILDADVGIRPQVEVDVVGGVLIYCDPETYPTSFPAQAGFGVAVGLHPRKAARFNPELYRHLKQLLRNERVVALGEVGLDRTEPADTWGLQEEVLIRILELSSPCQPIILHIRDGEDRQSGVLYLECLELLKPNVARTQKVVLHCFTGAQEVVVSWCKAFPNCFFSTQDKPGFSRRRRNRQSGGSRRTGC
jgi:Tat protein secretion system quality control protein TatD with DNase activity